ncbi:hypothetical protein G6F59_014681 [Rhizopus arrhizus]|nr:hypothetical protein G6F59_014681 [Rhizopus arrhizus]
MASASVTVLIGPSGAGKSTLLRLINHLERADSGYVTVGGQLIGYRRDGDTLYELPEREIRRRRAEVGMVFQGFNLFPHLTVLENCTLAPLLVKGVPADEARSRAMDYLERVRIPQHADNPRSCCSMSRPLPWILKWSRKCWIPWSPWPAMA